MATKAARGVIAMPNASKAASANPADCLPLTRGSTSVEGGGNSASGSRQRMPMANMIMMTMPKNTQP